MVPRVPTQSAPTIFPELGMMYPCCYARKATTTKNYFKYNVCYAALTSDRPWSRRPSSCWSQCWPSSGSWRWTTGAGQGLTHPPCLPISIGNYISARLFTTSPQPNLNSFLDSISSTKSQASASTLSRNCRNYSFPHTSHEHAVFKIPLSGHCLFGQSSQALASSSTHPTVLQLGVLQSLVLLVQLVSRALSCWAVPCRPQVFCADLPARRQSFLLHPFCWSAHQGPPVSCAALPSGRQNFLLHPSCWIATWCPLVSCAACPAGMQSFLLQSPPLLLKCTLLAKPLYQARESSLVPHCLLPEYVGLWSLCCCSVWKPICKFKLAQ